MMPRSRPPALPVPLVPLVLLLLGSTGPALAERTVVVELFTSQGCSSCPPADRLLSAIADSGVDGITIVPLAFHVDYWNYIGWTDPFSSADWSWRQRRYAAKLGSDTIFTPQLVIDGAAETVGADRRKVRQLVRAAAERSALARIETTPRAGHLRVTFDAAAAEPGALLAAIVETGFETEVGRGENHNRTLRNDHVVRRLETLGTVEPGRSMDIDWRPQLDRDWHPERVTAVIFVQGVDSLAIYGSAAIELSPPPAGLR